MTSLNPASDFDQWAPSYDRDVSGEGGFPFDGYNRILQRLIDLAAIEPGRPVLELGVGTGNLTRLLADRGATVWGLDFSQAMLAEARRKVPSARLAQADLLAGWPAAFRQPYPLILSSYVFHEFDPDGKRALLRQLFDHFLLPGGRVLIGDIGFPDTAARNRVRAAAGEQWDDEHYWLAPDAEALAADLGLALTFDQLSSCGVVLSFARRSRA